MINSSAAVQQCGVSPTHREAHVCQLFDETIHDPGIFLLPWNLPLGKMMMENYCNHSNSLISL